MEQEIKDISIERIRQYHPDAQGIANDLLIDYTEHFIEKVEVQSTSSRYEWTDFSLAYAKKEYQTSASI